MNIILFGPPGAGKGTQSKYLIKKLNAFQISTGDLLREEIKKNSDIGKQITNDMNDGIFISDNIVNEFSGIIAIPVLVLIGFTHLDAHPFEQVSNKAFTFHAVQVPLLQGEVAVHVETACCFSDV